MWRTLKYFLTDFQMDMTILRSTLQSINTQQAQINNTVGRQLTTLSFAVGRILVKIDPIYVDDELSPERREASNEIATAALTKIRTEYEAMRRMNP